MWTWGEGEDLCATVRKAADGTESLSSKPPPDTPFFLLF